MVRDEVVRIKEDGIAVIANKLTWLLLEKIITRNNSGLMSLSKTKATRRSPCYGRKGYFLPFLVAGLAGSSAGVSSLSGHS